MLLCRRRERQCSNEEGPLPVGARRMSRQALREAMSEGVIFLKVEGVGVMQAVEDGPRGLNLCV